MNEDKSLADKAVSIKGKDYVLVKDRIQFFNEHHPYGSITTELLSNPQDVRVVVKAIIKVPFLPTQAVELGSGKLVPEDNPTRCRTFTGHSQAVVGEGMVNKTAALENAETSAVGRALAMMGIGVIDSVASVDEMKKAAPKSVVERNDEPFPSYPPANGPTAFDDEAETAEIKKTLDDLNF